MEDNEYLKNGLRVTEDDCIEITRAATSNKEAIEQIDLISKFYDRHYKELDLIFENYRKRNGTDGRRETAL